MGKWKVLPPIILALVIARVGSGCIYSNKWPGNRAGTMPSIKFDVTTTTVAAAGIELFIGRQAQAAGAQSAPGS